MVPAVGGRDSWRIGAVILIGGCSLLALQRRAAASPAAALPTHAPAEAAAAEDGRRLAAESCGALLAVTQEHARRGGELTAQQAAAALPGDGEWLRDGVYAVLTKRPSVRVWSVPPPAQDDLPWSQSRRGGGALPVLAIPNASDPFIVPDTLNGGVWLFYTDTVSKRVHARRSADGSTWPPDGTACEGLGQRAYPAVAPWGGAEHRLLAAGPCDLHNPWEDWSRPGGQGFGLCLYETVRPGAPCPDEDYCKGWPFEWRRLSVVDSAEAVFHPTLLARPGSGLWIVATPRHIDPLSPSRHRMSHYSRPDARCRVWHAAAPEGPWSAISTVRGCSGPGAAVSAGAFVTAAGSTWRLAQNTTAYYGHSVRAWRVTRLEAGAYEEAPESAGNPAVIAASGSGWDALGAHVHAQAPVLSAAGQPSGRYVVASDGFAAPPDCAPATH
eukprot:TRINITY_DN51197_c0_g1_i1.p1 TRINITY_DN51197_c0_g1~~TRINITY_DN51197_c0_g1_i1.p1  ORF type:complete len:470 (+),score=90.33 TRINITY_DN51197_c0_g1_i1:88-1410(+)